MNIPNKRFANVVFYAMLAFQIVGICVFLNIRNNVDYRFVREVLLFALCFTGVPILGTFLLVVLEKIPSPRGIFVKGMRYRENHGKGGMNFEGGVPVQRSSEGDFGEKSEQKSPKNSGPNREERRAKGQ